MVFYILFLILMLLPLLWVTMRGKDAWPFSHYPMFSHLTDLSEVEVFRLALETKEGEIVWWRSRFYRYPEFVGRMLKQWQRIESEDGPNAKLAGLEKQRYLAEVLRLIDVEEGNAERYQAFHILRRTAYQDRDKGLVIHDNTIARIPLENIKRIRRGN